MTPPRKWPRTKTTDAVQDLTTIMPEIILSLFRWALLAAVFTVQTKLAPLLVWITSGLFVAPAFGLPPRARDNNCVLWHVRR
jgi:hypothetical protein